MSAHTQVERLDHFYLHLILQVLFFEYTWKIKMKFRFHLVAKTLE